MHFLAKFTTYTKLVTDVIKVSLGFALSILEFLQDGDIYFLVMFMDLSLSFGRG